MPTSSLNNSFAKEYIELNKRLARTMTIKSQASNDILNDFIIMKYGATAVDKYDPTSWKYYLNICGLYHSLDTQMLITSLDTLEEIVFSKENLAIHTATAKAYQYGTRYYYSLLNKYPLQNQLIMGILYPADMERAIDAEDGSILAYPDGLVEEQEITLLEELEAFIKRYLVRWNVQAFGLTDSLYNASYHAVLYLNLLPKLLNLRLKRCKTYEAHSFHIRMYLSSHGRLDRFMPYMTLKQCLYLYREINYIDRNSGKVEQLAELIDKLLTDRQIPVSEYSVRQLSNFDDGYYPEVTSRRKPINMQYNAPEMSYLPVDALYSKEEQLAYGNPRYYAKNAARDTYRFKTSVSSVIQSKDLESAMVDYNNAVPDPLDDVLIREWAYMANKGLYNVVITFRDPKSSELVSLYAVDAFAYMYYVSLMSVGVKVTEFPHYFNLKARKNPVPTVNDLLKVTDGKHKGMLEIATSLVTGQPKLTQCLSTTAFYEKALAIYNESRRHWFITSAIEDLYKRGQVDGMIHQLYEDEILKLDVSSSNIAEWLKSKNLEPYDYDYAQAQELIFNIFESSTGYSVDPTKVLKNIQKAMLAILTQLSSYSIQFIREINDSDLIPLNWPASRVGDIRATVGTEADIPLDTKVLEAKARASEVAAIDTGVTKVEAVEYKPATDTVAVDVPLTVVNYGTVGFECQVPIPSFNLSATYPGYVDAVSDQSAYYGKELFMALSDEQKNNIKSIW